MMITPSARANADAPNGTLLTDASLLRAGVPKPRLPGRCSWRDRLVRCALGVALVMLPCAPTASAQAPPSPAAAPVPAEMQLQPLSAIPTQGVFSIQSLQTSARGGQDPQRQGQEGSKAARLLAQIRDARFDRDGCLLALLVTSPSPDPRGDGALRILPAAAVRWDEGRRQWLAVEPNLQFAELAAENADSSDRSGTPKATPRTLLASLLVAAAAQAVVAAPPSPAGGPEATAPAGAGRQPAVIWMAPSLQRLVTIVIPIAALPTTTPAPPNRCVAVPWSLVSCVDAAGTCQLRFTPPAATIAAGAEAAEAGVAPNAALRQRGYAHFHLAAPGWDPAPDAAPTGTTTPPRARDDARRPAAGKHGIVAPPQ